MQILMTKPVYLGLSILKLSKIVMYEFWYDYVKPKYVQKIKLCYMETDIIYKKQILFINTLEKMLKQGLILQIMNQANHYLKVKIKRNWINER